MVKRNENNEYKNNKLDDLVIRVRKKKKNKICEKFE